MTTSETINLTLTLDLVRDTISGTFEWRETSNDGVVLFSNPAGQVTGTRIKVEL